MEGSLGKTMEITFRDRCKARDIIHKLRNQFNLKDVVKMLGVRYHYIIYCENMTKRHHSDDSYQCPKHVIQTVLDWADGKTEA